MNVERNDLRLNGTAQSYYLRTAQDKAFSLCLYSSLISSWLQLKKKKTEGLRFPVPSPHNMMESELYVEGDKKRGCGQSPRLPK